MFGKNKRTSLLTKIVNKKEFYNIQLTRVSNLAVRKKIIFNFSDNNINNNNINDNNNDKNINTTTTNDDNNISSRNSSAGKV